MKKTPRFTRPTSNEQGKFRSVMLNLKNNHDNSALYYRETYGDAIVAHKNLSAGNASMLVCRQHDGEWSDAPTPDLVVSVLRRGLAKSTVDLGAGRFRGTRTKGQIVLVAPGAGSAIFAKGQHEILALDIRYDRLRSLAPELNLPENGDFGPLHSSFLADPFLALLIENIWSASVENEGNTTYVEMGLGMVAASLSRLWNRPAASAAVGGLSIWQRRTAIERLCSSPNLRVSLSEVAETVNLSPFHFARAFKKSTGKSPHEYLMQLRIERACRLLETSQITITELSLEVGYDSPQSFGRAFVLKTGVTPSAWRAARLRLSQDTLNRSKNSDARSVDRC